MYTAAKYASTVPKRSNNNYANDDTSNKKSNTKETPSRMRRIKEQDSHPHAPTWYMAIFGIISSVNARLLY